jgi:hypothetical protein
MFRVEHLFHPLGIARTFRMRVRLRLHLRRFAAQSETRFRDDPRYQLENVTNGFASRLDDSGDDTEMLRRICTAYARTVADERHAPSCYEPTPWWKENRRDSLHEVTRALTAGDTGALHRMYSNFFRDPCGAGLVGVPFGNREEYFRCPMRDLHRRAYLGDMLYRLDYWKSVTGGSLELHDLGVPNIGNPYGILLDDTLIRFSAEYHHYCAYEVLKLNSSRCVVTEIGGGHGATAYYLLRDAETLTYLNFDVPESIALASYFLLKAFPSKTFTLYGEKDLTEETIATSDVLLLPAFALQKIPPGIVDVTFASHVLNDFSRDALVAYMDFVSRATQDYFVYFGNERAVASISHLLHASRGCAPPLIRPSDWNRHKIPDYQEVEAIYEICGK